MSSRQDFFDNQEDCSSPGAVRIQALTRGSLPGRPLAPNIIPGVDSVGVWESTVPQAWGLAQYSTTGIAVIYVESGHLDFETANRWYSLNAGSLAITAPGKRHRLGTPHAPPARVYWIELSLFESHKGSDWPKWLQLADEELADLDRLLHKAPRVSRADSATADAFRRIGRLVETDPPTLPAHLTTSVGGLLTCLLDSLRTAKAGSTNRGRSALKVEALRRQLANTLEHDWSIDEMALETGLSVSQFARLFKRLTGEPPMHYLASMRVARAKCLLAYAPDKTLEDVAELCGFSSGHYMISVFNRLEDTTPGAYRDGFLDSKSRAASTDFDRGSLGL
jgi:AraC-like DNA-binding protein